MSKAKLNDTVARLVLQERPDFEWDDDMEKVNRRLRMIASGKEGLGSAILAAWAHGVGVEHIPLEIDGKRAEVKALPSDGGCDYTFVHVPLRVHRNDKEVLAEKGIQEPDPDLLRLVYHEDGLVFGLSFQDPREHGLSAADVAEVIGALHQQRFLIKANIHNRQIQFKDLAVKELIERSGQHVYVVDHGRLANDQMRLPAGLHRDEVLKYVKAVLRSKKECNYCSIGTLNPREATIYSAHVPDLDTARNYQFGFTFAPFGDPQDVCHFLAWDTPHIGDVVMNMDPQAYSFSDLIRLVHRINLDITRRMPPSEGDREWEPIAGICNHWAGNSIYHQHYQFFRIQNLPMLSERRMRTDNTKAAYKRVTVKRIDWKAPAYCIRSASEGWDPDVLWVADRVAREWDLLSEGYNTAYGNGIPIQYHSQNIYVRVEKQQTTAIFIPRHRRKLSTLHNPASKDRLQKNNAGTLEMMGYFIVDNEADYDELRKMSPAGRRALGDAWLTELAPDDSAIDQFETNLGIALNTPAMAHYQARIDALVRETRPCDLGRTVWDLATIARLDPQLGREPTQRELVYLELLSLFQSESLRLS